MDTATYRFRLHLFDVESTYTLRDDELVIERDNGRTETIPLNEIRLLRLRDGGTCYGVPTYSCVIKTARCKVVLSSAHYAGIGELESRAEAYRRFVLALQHALEPHQTAIRFIAGSRVYQLTALAVLVFGSLVLLGVAAMFWLSPGHPRSAGFLAKGLLFIALAPSMLGVARLGGPKDFDPTEVQEAYLP